MRGFISTALCLMLMAVSPCAFAETMRPDNYASAMVSLIQALHDYANADGKRFSLITNGGAGLFYADEENSEENVRRLLENIDGAAVESVFYGWNMTQDEKTPKEETAYFKELLRVPVRYGIHVFNIDYGSEIATMKAAYEKDRVNHYVGFVSGRRELDEIPVLPANDVNFGDCMEIRQVKNFLPLLNPGNYSNKAEYVNALRNTDYDMLVIDLYFDDQPLDASDIRLLQYKANGGRRLVIAYMSIGEAEDYRPYWQEEWKENPPVWMDASNEDWEGNYKVKYWSKEWQGLLYGHEESYLDMILKAGFDGAFLDVVDAYEYFNEKES